MANIKFAFYFLRKFRPNLHQNFCIRLVFFRVDYSLILKIAYTILPILLLFSEPPMDRNSNKKLCIISLSIRFLNTRLWYCLGCIQKNQEISWKRFDQYFFSQVQVGVSSGKVIKLTILHNSGNTDRKLVVPLPEV